MSKIPTKTLGLTEVYGDNIADLDMDSVSNLLFRIASRWAHKNRWEGESTQGLTLALLHRAIADSHRYGV